MNTEWNPHSDPQASILHHLSHQPRIPLPENLRTHPLDSKLPKKALSKSSLKSKLRIRDWSTTTRTWVISSLLLLAILIVMAAFPTLRAMREHLLNERLQSLITEELTQDESLAPLPMAGLGESDEILEGGEESEAESHSTLLPTDLTVGKNEVWRFNLKTASPREVRAKIVQFLQKTFSELRPNDPLPQGLGGIQAPGGIQFNLLAPSELVAPLKSELESLAAPPKDEITPPPTNTLLSDPFTWFKNRSRIPLEAGKVRVVIWLQQI